MPLSPNLIFTYNHLNELFPTPQLWNLFLKSNVLLKKSVLSIKKRKSMHYLPPKNKHKTHKHTCKTKSFAYLFLQVFTVLIFEPMCHFFFYGGENLNPPQYPNTEKISNMLNSQWWELLLTELTRKNTLSYSAGGIALCLPIVLLSHTK